MIILRVIFSFLLFLSIISVSEADVYIATSGGVYVLSGDLLHGPYLKNYQVHRIAVDRYSGDIAFATLRGQVWKYDKDITTFIGNYTSSNLNIVDIAMDLSGNIGVASTDGLYRLSGNLYAISGPFFTDLSFTHITLDVQRSAWIVQSTEGKLYGYNNRMDTLMGSPASVVPNSAGGLVVDSTGSVLTITDDGVGYRFENDATHNPFGITFGPYFDSLDPIAFTVDLASDSIYAARQDQSIAGFTSEFSGALGVWGEDIDFKFMEVDPVSGSLVIATQSNHLLIFHIGTNGALSFERELTGLSGKSIYHIKATPKTVNITYCNPAVNNPFHGDLNGDCVVDILDYLILAQQWLVCYQAD